MLSVYHLPNSLPNERLVRIVRRDVFILIQKVLMSFVLLATPIILLSITASFFPNLFEGELSRPIMILSISSYYLFIWLFFFFSFIDYYLDVWIITNERIVDIQQLGFFSRVISEHRLYRIQDVTSEIHGPLATFFRFGEVHIQTAGAKQRFYFSEVPHPNNIRNLIIDLSEKSKMIHKADIENERGIKLQEKLDNKNDKKYEAE